MATTVWTPILVVLHKNTSGYSTKSTVFISDFKQVFGLKQMFPISLIFRKALEVCILSFIRNAAFLLRKLDLLFNSKACPDALTGRWKQPNDSFPKEVWINSEIKTNVEPCKCQPHKTVKHTQTICWQQQTNCFSVWPFCGVGT